MPRRLLISPQFEPQRARLSILPGSAEADAVARSMRVLSETDDLPFLHSEELLLPPSLWAWRYPVPRTQLALIYAFDAETITFISVRRLRGM